MPRNYSTMEIVISVAIILAIFSVIHLVYFARKDPFSTIAWPIGIIFVPFVGLVFYLFFGIGIRTNMDRIIRKKVRSDKEIVSTFDEYEEQNQKYMEALKQGEVVLNDPNAKKYLSHISMQYHMGGSLFSQNNDVTIYTDAAEHYEALLTDIRGAKSSINLLFYLQ